MDIYLITNLVTGQVYVGKAENYLERFERHILQSKDDNKNCNSISKNMRIYGKEKFNVIRLEQCEDDKWREREMFWINHYKEIHKDKCLNILNGTGALTRPILELHENKVYQSLSEAAEALDLKKSDIYYSCREKLGLANLNKRLLDRLKGYSFRYTFLTAKEAKQKK